MEFTDTQQEILANAHLLAHDGGKGQVLEDWAFPDAHELAEHGWLSRRFEANGDMSWHWTDAAEHALDVNALLSSAQGRQN
jgi:hypothetical protein